MKTNLLPKARGQTAMEYLLIIGTVLLVVLLVTVLVMTINGQGSTDIGTSTDAYHNLLCAVQNNCP